MGNETLAGWTRLSDLAAQSTSGGEARGTATRPTFTPAEEHVVRLIVFQGKTWKEVGNERLRSNATNRTLLQRALDKADLGYTNHQHLRGNAAGLGLIFLEDLFPEKSLLELVRLIAEPPSNLEELLQLVATQPSDE